MSIVADHILEAAIAAVRPRYEGWQFPLPTGSELRTVIEAVFWASIAHEEGKEALVGVLLADPNSATCRLASTKCTWQSLRKLSPFCDEKRNFIYCNAALELVGVGPANTFRLSVHAERPGVLVLALVDSVIAVLEGGVWHVVDRSPHDLSILLRRTFSDEFPANSRKASLLIGLAMGAWRAHRGAIFATIDAANSKGLTLSQYAVESFSIGTDVLATWGELDDLTSSHRYDLNLTKTKHESATSLAKHFANVVSAGAGMDGATVLDRFNLRVIGFGAKICAHDDQSEVLIVDSSSESIIKAKKADLGGMRHQSAACLVAANHDAMVLTVSQDGAITLFRWLTAEGMVAAVQRVDRFLRAPIVVMESTLW